MKTILKMLPSPPSLYVILDCGHWVKVRNGWSPPVTVPRPSMQCWVCEPTREPTTDPEPDRLRLSAE